MYEKIMPQKKFVPPSKRYSVQYPFTWKCEPDSTDSEGTMMFFKEGGKGTLRLSGLHVHVDSKELNKMQDEYQRKVKKSKRYTFNKIDILYFEQELKENNIKLRILWWYLLKGNTWLFFSYTTPLIDDVDTQELEVIRMIIESVQFY